MLGFVGMIDGEMIYDAVDFIVTARESEECIPDEAIGVIMNKLTDSQLESVLFTKKEIKLLDQDRLEQFEKEKLYSLTKIEDEYDECCCNCNECIY